MSSPAERIAKHSKNLDENITHMINYLVELKDAMQDNKSNRIYEERFKIQVMSKITERNAAFLARAIDAAAAEAKKEKEGYIPPPVKVFDATVVNPENQGLVDALLAKALSYPDDKIYQKNAYITVAERVATHTTTIGITQPYSWRPNEYHLTGIKYYINAGPSIRNFIIEYLKNNQ